MLPYSCNPQGFERTGVNLITPPFNRWTRTDAAFLKAGFCLFSQPESAAPIRLDGVPLRGRFAEFRRRFRLVAILVIDPFRGHGIPAPCK